MYLHPAALQPGLAAADQQDRDAAAALVHRHSLHLDDQMDLVAVLNLSMFKVQMKQALRTRSCVLRIFSYS